MKLSNIGGEVQALFPTPLYFNQLNRLRKDLRNRKKRLEKVIAVKRLALQAVQDKIAREVDKQND